MSSISTVRRSAADHKVSGLCGGIARQWGVDPVLVRVGCVLLALSGGIGVVLYVAGWLMVPLDGRTRSQLEEVVPPVDALAAELKVALVVVACVLGAVSLAPVLPFGFGSALILAAIWYFGYYKNRSHGTGSGDATSSGPTSTSDAGASSSERPQATQLQFFDFGDRSTPFTDAANAWQQRIREHQRAAASASAPSFSSTSSPAAGPAPSPAPAQPNVPSDHDAFWATPDPAGLYEPRPAQVVRPPSRALSKPARRLRLASLLVLGLTMTGLGVASAFGVPVSVTTYLAAALLVAGLTLVAAAWLGRARGILPVALLLALATTFSAVGGTGLDRPGVGVHKLSYTSSSTMPAADGWQSGAMTVDLSGLDVTASRSYDVNLEQGQLKIIVPPSARVAVVATVHDGYLKIDDRKGTWGSELTDTLPYTGADPSGPVLTVRAGVGQGMVEVQR